MSYDDNDPFAGGDKRPSLSFKDLPIGTTFRLVVDEPPKKVHKRDYQTGEPAYWTNKDGTKSEKWTVVTGGHVDGEPRSVWADVPSQLFSAIAEAQKAAGKRIAEGGVLVITLTERRINPEKPRNAPQNIHAVTYTPPASADPFSDQAPTPPAQPAVSAPPPASGGQVAELKAQIANLRKTGLTDAQIIGTGMVKGVDGSPLDATSLAALDAVA